MAHMRRSVNSLMNRPTHFGAWVPDESAADAKTFSLGNVETPVPATRAKIEAHYSSGLWNAGGRYDEIASRSC